MITITRRGTTVIWNKGFKLSGTRIINSKLLKIEMVEPYTVEELSISINKLVGLSNEDFELFSTSQ